MPKARDGGLNEPFLGASRPASPQRPAASARGSTSSRSTSSHSVEAPRLAESVEAETYGDGLTTVNYVDVQFERRGGDPEDSQDPTGTIQPFVEDICKICAEIEEKYGFQPSSVRNQRENVLMLVANTFSNIRGANDTDDRKMRAVEALHHHTLSSFQNWATNMHGMSRTEAYGRVEGEESDTYTLLFEVVLWWCIWGEAANMRFIPEFLSWVFWSLIQNRRDRVVSFGRYEDGQGFLRKVMRPMYEFVKAEAFKRDQAGNNCDHSQKKNLDDINEYFWRRRGDTVCTSFRACEDGAMDSMIEQLGTHRKTYVERRGLLHSVKSNLRVFTVYICLFHLIVTIAHFVPFEQSTVPLCPPQTEVDSCQGATEEDECKRISGCNWGNPGQGSGLDDPDSRDRCFDTCQWCPQYEIDGKQTCEGHGQSDDWMLRPKEECTAGCKWSSNAGGPGEEPGSCHMYNAKSSQEVLDAIEQTTSFNCDLGTGICRYRDSKNKPVAYSCLQRLTPEEQREYVELNKGEWWEGGSLGVTGLWDGVPIIGRLTRFFNPPGDNSDMSAKRANQTHMFDKLWAKNAFEAKREFLQKQDQLFTCGYDIGTPDGLMKAANASHCCNVHLTKPDVENHGFVEVWLESEQGCRWTLLDVFTEEYRPVRVELFAVAMTLLACRLLGELLSWIAIWDSETSKWFKAGKMLYAAWYAVMLAALTFVLNRSDEENQEQLDDLRKRTGQLQIAGAATLFEVLAALSLVPELVMGSNSVLSAITKIALACCGTKAREWRRAILAWCQPGYVRKITGRMSSATWSWLKYSIIWIILLWCKCYFSYVFEIRLAVKNEATTWRAIATPFRRSEVNQLGDEAPFWDEFLLNKVQSNDGGVVVAEVVVFLTWVPIFLVFLMDCQIAFSVCQMIVGVWTGVSLRVGHVNTWAAFEGRLARKLIRKFRINLDATITDSMSTIARTGSLNAPVGVRMTVADDHFGSFKNQAPGSRVPAQGMRGTRLYGPDDPSYLDPGTMLPSNADNVVDTTTAFDFKRSAPSFRRFVECWNLFIHKLRYDDYLSDHEASLYKCLVLDTLGSPWLPPLLSLDGIANLLDRIDDLEDAHKALFHGRIDTRTNDGSLWKRDTAQFVTALRQNANHNDIGEALKSVQTLTLFLLKRITGADGRSQPFEKGRGIVLWFRNLKFESCESPILRTLLTDPTSKSAKGRRHELIDTIARFADTVANHMCSLEDGPSKQRGTVFDRAADRVDLNMDKIANATRDVLMQIQSLCEGTQNDDLPVGTIQQVLSSAMFVGDEDEDTRSGELKRLLEVGEDREVQQAATYLHQILKVRRADAVPKNNEALRRILTFASSLHMEMPEPRTVETCKSLTSFTPFYEEDVLYTKEQIMEEKGQASMCSYLQTVHPDEWRNLVERLGIAKEAKEVGDTIPEWVWTDDAMATEVRLWASLRGQTLARTIHGVMQVEEGLKLFARQEAHQEWVPNLQDMSDNRRKLWHSDSLWERYAHMKFQYVVSCQVYGKWPETNDKKKSVDLLMRLFPHLRIAYVQEELDHNGEKKWFSNLVRWCRVQQKVVKCYRIEQAADKGGNGNWGPTWLVGEGKPENQNHAIVFTRGQYLQTLDMNQDGYFEEGLKMRNLLEEFTADQAKGIESKHDHQVRIIGFPEHQFSDTLSAVAEFSALTEFTFATLIQRSLASPFDVRMHYGHPDLFDRVFHVTRGGISKPMKFLCVSEDIFGAFNCVLKGGRVIYREYIKQGKGKDLGFDACSLFEQKISGGNGEQALSRDYARLCEQMGITRLLSFFHSSNGFYWSNVFVIWSTNWFLYGQILLSVVIPDDNAEALQTVTESVVFAFQLGMVLTVPLVAELVLEKGALTALEQMARVVCRGGPLFFMFHIRTKAYYYDRSLVLGGAGYKATGRGFVLKHTGFVQLFSMFHYSHLNYGMTLFFNLLVYRFFIVDPDSYWKVTWATWLFALDLLFAPFIFNCLALDRAAVLKDVEDWSQFLWRDDRQVQYGKNKGLAEAAKESWRAYFLSENAVYVNVDVWTRLSMIFRDIIWVVLPQAVLLERNATSTENVSGHFWRAIGISLGTVLAYSLGVVAILIVLVLLWEEFATKCDCMCSCRRKVLWGRAKRGSYLGMCKSRKLKRYALVLFSVLIGWTLISLFMDYGKPLEVVAIYLTTGGYLLAFTTNCIFYMGFRPEWLFTVYWLHDAAIGYLILAPFFVLSIFRTFCDAHMLLLYNSNFVEVLSTMTFKSQVMGVVKHVREKPMTTTPARRARSRQSAPVDGEPEPEPELGR